MYKASPTYPLWVDLEQKPALEKQSILKLLEEIHQQRPIGRSVEEINRDLQAERDAWDN